MKRIVNALGKLNWGKGACAVFALIAMTAITLSAQTFTTLHTFSTDGDPFAGLVQATNGYLYGTTNGSGGYGTVFKITTRGVLTTLHSFDWTDGDGTEGLIQATNGNLYGTTQAGGTNGVGTVFKITPSGTLTTLHSFDGTDGAGPQAGLVQATDGNFYGTTLKGGSCTAPGGCGTVFKITPAGTLTTLHSFCSENSCADGLSPYAGLVQGSDGNLYGTTANGGANCASAGGCGTVFKIALTGTLTTMYNFCALEGCADGGGPQAGLIQATDGNFYGTTACGGANVGTHCGGAGTVFKITPTGTLTTLYSFCSQAGCTDGQTPFSGLVQATDGNFYGTAYYGGSTSFCTQSVGCGTLFRITPSGALTTLYSFCSQAACADGETPRAGLVQDTNGEFYGTATYGGGGTCGPSDCGTVFSLSVGLGGFVETLPTAAKTGAPLTILGTNLTGASSVTLNGVPVSYSVNSTGTAITTTVPAETTTGPVQVVTPSGTLSSNLPFRVLPALSSFAPTRGAIGTVVTINGQSLTQTTGVTFGGVPAAFAVVSDSAITATVPTGALTGSITVTTAGGVATAAGAFRVTPKITGFSPGSGPVGTPVTINGQSFTQTTGVTFGGVTAAFTVNSDTEITATVPTGAVTGRIDVATPGGTATSATAFKVN